jgi:hypothetical protein
VLIKGLLGLQVGLIVVVRMQLIDLIDWPISLDGDRLYLLLRRYLVVLVVELDEVGVALLDIGNLHLLLVAILLLPLLDVGAHLWHRLPHGIPHPRLLWQWAIQELS